VFSVLCTYINLSRFGMIAFYVLGITFFMLTKPIDYFKILVIKKRMNKKWMYFSIFILSFLLVVIIYNQYKDSKSNFIVETIKRDLTIENTSNDIRKGLIKNGWILLVDSYGLGVGAGNFDAYHKAGLVKHWTNNIINPHNWTIQVLSQYGLFIFIPLFWWYLQIFFLFFKNRKLFIENNDGALPLLMGSFIFVVYFIISNSGSTFIANNLNWMMILLMAICADYVYQNKQKYAE
jgi:teichuronic acid biosynthesis protein TuaE